MGLVWRFSRFVCSDKTACPAGDDTLLPLLVPCHLSHLLGAALPLSLQLSETRAPANPGKKQQTTKLHQFFLNSFLSAAICCRAWGKSIKTDKNEFTNLWYSAPKLGRFPGAASGVSWEEGEEAGEGEGEKMNSCKAIKPASLPYGPKQEAI